MSHPTPRSVAIVAIILIPLVLTSCGGGGGGSTPPPPATYTLTVNSSGATGVAITVSPADNSTAGNGTTNFTRTYNSGGVVTLTAPAKSGTTKFSTWSGCTSAATVTCTAKMSGNLTVSATYVIPAITGVTVTPNPAPVSIGATQQFTATVAGNGTFDTSVTWSLVGPPATTFSSGTISDIGLYTTPYPAPATITVVATSKQDPTVSGSATINLAPPATANGPHLTVDAGTLTLHLISPDIYGMNAYQLAAPVIAATSLPVARWGGDSTSRYNYKLNDSSSAGDYFFLNSSGSGVAPTGKFDDLVAADVLSGTKTLATVPVLGWVAKDSTSCSFPVSKYPGQQKVDPSNTCGNGVKADGTNVTGNDPTDTSIAVGPSWAGDWATYLVGKFGTAAKGGVAIYDLDNEPTWWNAVHRDVHPIASTYDEVTVNGIATAVAIKTADPTAETSGPVVDFWWNYFYSKKDIEAGWGNGPCYSPWDNPVDRDAHGGVAFLEYYLQQFQAWSKAHGNLRALDYLDLHTYDAGSYNGNSLNFSPAGDTGDQQARLNSTRFFWDSTYIDPGLPQANYTTDPGYTSSCDVPALAPQIIPQMHTWIANNYPGTKTAITEYNWGAQEHINGSLAQADILGIFGREGLDLAALWGPPDPVKQVPGQKAFEIYRNYDASGGKFGETALTSTSSDQSKLSVYGAERSADNTVTVVVINKTYGDLSATLTLPNLTPAGKAKVYQYSAANLATIVAQPDLTVTPLTPPSTTSILQTTFPAQSITLLAIPKI